MLNFKAILIVLIASLGVSCASTTLINSEPSGAKLYIDGNPVGKTPYTHSDTKIVGSTTQIRMEKEGCDTFHGVLTRSENFEVGPCIGGVFVLVPFLWVMGYNPQHTYTLNCEGGKKSELSQNRSELFFASHDTMKQQISACPLLFK